jgi:hypothetical protein
MAVIDLATGDVRGVIMASPDDPPYEGTKLVQIHNKALVDSRFTWSESEGFQPKDSYLAKIKADPEDHPVWRQKMRARMEKPSGKYRMVWNAVDLRFDLTEID